MDSGLLLASLAMVYLCFVLHPAPPHSALQMIHFHVGYGVWDNDDMLCPTTR